jgi:hypothetical protein
MAMFSKFGKYMKKERVIDRPFVTSIIEIFVRKNEFVKRQF